MLFASLHRCGLAAQAASVRAGDGQRLLDTWVGAAVRCAPPANKPTVTERDTCTPWLTAEIGFLSQSLRVIVCLGGLRLAGAMAGAARFRLPAAPAPAGLRARRGGHAARPRGPAATWF